MVLVRWNNLLLQHPINKLTRIIVTLPAELYIIMSVTSGGVKGSDNVQVAVRCRPLSSGEEKAGHSVVVKVDSEQGEVILTPPTSKSRHQEKPRTFYFDSTFGFDSQQLDIYNETARPIVDSVLQGYNGILYIT